MSTNSHTAVHYNKCCTCMCVLISHCHNKSRVKLSFCRDSKTRHSERVTAILHTVYTWEAPITQLGHKPSSQTQQHRGLAGNLAFKFRLPFSYHHFFTEQLPRHQGSHGDAWSSAPHVHWSLLLLTGLSVYLSPNPIRVCRRSTFSSLEEPVLAEHMRSMLTQTGVCRKHSGTSSPNSQGRLAVMKVLKELTVPVFLTSLL